MALLEFRRKLVGAMMPILWMWTIIVIITKIMIRVGK